MVNFVGRSELTQEFSSSSIQHVLSLVQSLLLRKGWRREWDLNPRGTKAHRISAPALRFSNPTPYLARRSRRSMSVAFKPVNNYVTNLNATLIERRDRLARYGVG